MTTKTGEKRTRLRYFLTDLGENQAILGYPWFASAQPKIDWAKGWIDYNQLPIVLRTDDANKAIFVTRAQGKKATIKRMKVDERVPPQYRAYMDVFSDEESKKYPPKRPWDHRIELKPGAPATLISKTIPLSATEQRELEEFIKEHEARGTIRRSKSPYAASFFFIKKKNGKLRPVQDYRPINEWTIKNRYPLPLIPQLIDRIGNAELITVVDIRWGYNTVQIIEEDRHKAAFVTNRGLFEPTVMFFGLTNSPATFQTMMDTIFHEQIARGTLTVYMDDIAIHTKRENDETEDQHLQRHRQLVREMLTILRKHSLYLNIDKCQFEKQEVDYLGVRIGGRSIKMEEAKVERVKTWRPPRNVTEVRRFLGFTGYYRYFIKGYSQIARPLLDLTKKSTEWHWEEPQQRAFEGLRDKMCSKPVLTHPDPDRTFYLQTDASTKGVGAVLTQEADGTRKRKPIAYYSGTFSPAEENYDIYEKEFLAVLKALEHWRAHLIWTKKPFIIETDHKNLTHWKEPKRLTGRTARWHEKLQDYNFKIVHIAGTTNGPADALSRLDDGEEQREARLTPLISSDAFLNVFEAGDLGTIENEVVEAQQKQKDTMEDWSKRLPIEKHEGPQVTTWTDHQGRLVVPPDDDLKKKILRELHDHWGAGHPGRDETTRRVQRGYFWPLGKAWIARYIQGCATCQQNKNLTHVTKTPLYKITVPENAPPFTQIAMDLITGLPKS